MLGCEVTTYHTYRSRDVMIGNAQTKVNEGLRMPLDWIAHPHQSATTKEFALEHTYHDNRAEISANHSKEILREAA